MYHFKSLRSGIFEPFSRSSYEYETSGRFIPQPMHEKVTL